MSVKETIERVRELFDETQEGRIVDVDYITTSRWISVYIIVIDNHLVYQYHYFKNSSDIVELKDVRVLA